MTRIAAHIRQRYPKPGRQELFAAKLAASCQAFIDSGLADPKFTDELVSGSDSKFWSCVSEALLAERLKDKTFPSRARSGYGPDLLVLCGNRKVWIESICPEPIGLPDVWLNIQANTVGDFPHQAILLRWTAALKEKAEKLLGSPDGQISGYLAKGVVRPDEAYVVAVNGCRLRHGPFSALLGISQFPFAAEAVFPIGPYQLQINRETLEVVERGYQVRFHVENRNKALVPTSMFIDPHFAGISAIWANEFDGSSVIGNQERSVVVHNPLANNSVPVGFLNADHEYTAVKDGDEYVFSKVEQACANVG
jgi:type I restriction enzyme S subunit